MRLVLARALALLAAALLVAGCMTSHDVVTGRGWKLVQIGESAPVDPDGVVGIAFGEDGRFTLDTGCNSGGGTFGFDGNRVRLDKVILTTKGCEGAIGAQETAILGVLNAAPTWAVETGSGRLVLTGADGEVLRFEAP